MRLSEEKIIKILSTLPSLNDGLCKEFSAPIRTLLTWCFSSAWLPHSKFVYEEDIISGYVFRVITRANAVRKENVTHLSS